MTVALIPSHSPDFLASQRNADKEQSP